MKTLILFLSIFTSTLCFAQKESGLRNISIEGSKSIVSYLADDKIEGREAGTRGAKMAADYIVEKLESYGLDVVTGYDKDLNNKYFHSFDTTKLSVKFSSQPQKMHLRNILAQIEGENPNEIVIIGAHYDHYGIRSGKIYNGADDNASGVSAVLQIASAFVKSGVKPKRTVIFALWDGEEKGLLGSSRFVKSFKNINNVKAYLNFDMIGRNSDELNPKTFTYFYTAKNGEFEQWLRESIIEYSLDLKPQYNAWENPVSGSDNA
ncbi:MAG: M20/M25/M40 family metallo-hydrolase, partial [Rikenellaceae bacterium]